MIESTKDLTVDQSSLQATSCGGWQLNATHASYTSCLVAKCRKRSKPLRLSAWQWLPILFLAFCVQSAAAQTTWSIGAYFPSSIGGNPPISAIEWSALTHVQMVGGQPISDGSVTLASGFSTDAPALITAAHANGVKVLFALTNLDIGAGSNDGWTGAASSSNLSKFVTNIMSVVNAYGFDGVDLDWETTWNTTEITNLISGLRVALGTKILTAVNVSTGSSGGTNPGCNTGGTFTTAMLANLDRMSIPAYDSNGVWNPETWFSEALYTPAGTPLYSVDSNVKAARACGYDLTKVNIGIPFYGYLTSPSNGPYQPFGSSPSLTQIGYANMLATYGFSGFTFDPTADVPWRAVSGSSWIQWENAQSVTDKVNYVQTNGLGGWVIWVLGWDYTAAASPQMPLLDAVGKALAPKVQPPTNLQITSVN